MRTFKSAFTTFFAKKMIWRMIAVAYFYRFGEGLIEKIGPLFLLDRRALGGLELDNVQLGTINGTYCPSGGSQPPPRSPFDLPTLAIVAAIILAAISIFVLLARRRRRDLMRKR